MNPHDRPERPEIVDADAPRDADDDESWYPLIWETVEEFIVRSSRNGGGRKLHLSARTFPGGREYEDEPTPHCRASSSPDTTYTPKSPAVYPEGYLDVCPFCVNAFRLYHETGTPTTATVTQDFLESPQQDHIISSLTNDTQ